MDLGRKAGKESVDIWKVLGEDNITSEDSGGSEDIKVSGDSCSTKTVTVIDKFTTVRNTRKFRKFKTWESLIARSVISQPNR